MAPCSLPRMSMSYLLSWRIWGYPLMQGTQHVLMAQSCVSMVQQRAQKQAQQQRQAETMP